MMKTSKTSKLKNSKAPATNQSCNAVAPSQDAYVSGALVFAVAAVIPSTKSKPQN